MSVAFDGHVGPWTPVDVEKLIDTGDHSRYELLTPGVLTVSPAPGTVHQRVSRRLANLLEAAVSSDFEVLETVNIETADGRLAVPDVAVAYGDVADGNPVRYPPGSVLLVVEIVSLEASHKTDLSNRACMPQPVSTHNGGSRSRMSRA